MNSNQRCAWCGSKEHVPACPLRIYQDESAELGHEAAKAYVHGYVDAYRRVEEQTPLKNQSYKLGLGVGTTERRRRAGRRKLKALANKEAQK